MREGGLKVYVSKTNNKTNKNDTVSKFYEANASDKRPADFSQDSYF